MRRLLSVILSIAFAVSAFAAAKVTVTPPPRASEGDKFVVTIRVTDGQVESQPAVPNIPGCQYIFGPAVSSSFTTQIVNGRSVSASACSYTFTYRADKAGTATIPSINLRVDGHTVTTKPVKFTIDERGAASSANSSTRNRPVSVDDISTQSSDRQVGSNDVFVRIILNRSTAYEQEAIECTIKLYTKYGIEQFFATKQPEFDGFLIQEVDLRPTLNQRESYNGQTYMTAVLKKCIIFPQKSGKLTINSGEYDLSVVQFDNVGMGYFSVAAPTTRKIKVSSNSASIDIKPLPQPAPEGFSGAVGQFKADARLIGNKFLTGDAASLVYTITGTGNIKYVKEPEIDFPSEFELYTPKSNFEGGVRGATVTGTMTIDYTFVPKSVGEFQIGSDRFVYFDPEKNDYVVLTTPSFTVKVGAGAEHEKKEITAKNTDILHIKQGAKGGTASDLILGSLLFWSLWVISLVVLFMAIALRKRNERLNADVRGRKMSRALKVATNRLKTSRALMEKGDSEKFYSEILQAVTGYLSDKLGIPASQLSRDNIATALQERGASQELVNKFIDTLDMAETARYTPGDNAEKTSKLYSEAADAIKELERQQKAKK